MITITLRRIMDCKPCYNPIERGIFEKDHDLDAPISFRWLAELIPPRDVVWCFTNLPDEYNALKRHFAVDCAERVKHLITDERSLNALAVARKHALGEASDIELSAAWDAAKSARGTAEAAAEAARVAYWAAALAASDAADAAVRSAARDSAEAAAKAAKAAAWASAWDAAAGTSWDAAGTAWDAAWAVKLRWQSQRIIELTDAGEWSPVGEK